MKKEIAELWARRLPEFNRVSGVLRRTTVDGDCFCVLGVLCELAVEHKVIDPPRLMCEGADKYHYGAYADGSAAGLPPEVQKWAGMFSNAGNFRNGLLDVKGEKCHSLVVVNDCVELPFTEMAKIILDNVENL